MAPHPQHEILRLDPLKGFISLKGFIFQNRIVVLLYTALFLQGIQGAVGSSNFLHLFVHILIGDGKGLFFNLQPGVILQLENGLNLNNSGVTEILAGSKGFVFDHGHG